MIRHIAFWAVWWVAYFLFFHLPLHAISGWNLNEVNENLRENGGLWLLKMMVFNVLLAVVVPQMIFTYTMLYFILPRYFYQKRNLFVIVAAVSVLLGSYLILSGFFKSLSQLPNYWMGLRTTFPCCQRLLFFAALRDTLTSLPIVAGLALVIKLMKRLWLKEKETQQLAEEKIKAELQVLKAQVHPHFLFNTLNNIYFYTLSGSAQASEMIKKLSDMLHYILSDCNRPQVPLESEIKMIEDYVSLEKIRYGEQIDLSLEIEENLGSEDGVTKEWLIAPLLLIPFVENSFKHGASKMLSQAYIKLRMAVENNALNFSITNSCPQMPEAASPNVLSSGKPGNIGLKNVKKRLQLLYPCTHELSIITKPESFTVYLNIQLHNSNPQIEDRKEMKFATAYGRA